MNDVYWLKELKQGNSMALSYFFDLHYQALCYFAESIVKDQQEAEDIVATSFFKIWNKHDDFDTAQNIKAFLYISTKNACLDHLKKLKRQTTAQQGYFQQLNLEEDYIQNYFIEAEFLHILNMELEKLPERCKEVFKLIYVDGLKTNEIAELLDLSVKTVRNHKARAVSLLQLAFSEKNLLPLFFFFINEGF